MDCVVAVFSLTERASLAEAGAAVARLQARVPALPAILVGNKTDLVRTRRVSAEGDPPRPALASHLRCISQRPGPWRGHATASMLRLSAALQGGAPCR